MSEDGIPVVTHDPAVDRTQDGKIKVGELTFAETKELDAGSWKGTEFEGERIPELRETLVAMPINLWLNVHLKGRGDSLRIRRGTDSGKRIGSESRGKQLIGRGRERVTGFGLEVASGRSEWRKTKILHRDENGFMLLRSQAYD